MTSNEGLENIAKDEKKSRNCILSSYFLEKSIMHCF